MSRHKKVMKFMLHATHIKPTQAQNTHQTQVQNIHSLTCTQVYYIGIQGTQVYKVHRYSRYIGIQGTQVFKYIGIQGTQVFTVHRYSRYIGIYGTQVFKVHRYLRYIGIQGTQVYKVHCIEFKNVLSWWFWWSWFSCGCHTTSAPFLNILLPFW